MSFYVYYIQNNINLKIYIGKSTKQKDPLLRWKEHLKIVNRGIKKGKESFSLIHKAISKYGKEKFIFQILEDFDLELDALEAEKFWIEFFRTDVNRYGNEFGYNLTAGGDGISGYKHSENTKLKISLKNKGRRYSVVHTQEHIDKISKYLVPGNIKFKIEWPEDIELINMVKQSSMRKVAKLLGVTQQAISHRFKTRKLK